MTSHVEEQIRKRIAAAKEKTRDDREAFNQARAAGLDSRKRTKLRRTYCAACARLQRRGTYLRCPLGCGQALCKTRADCGNSHLRQCDNRPTPEGN